MLDGSKSSIISIHALLAESDHYDNYNLHCTEISIHALLAESDEQAQGFKIPALRISIHALLAESDETSGFLIPLLHRFLSTLSLRRATFARR